MINTRDLYCYTTIQPIGTNGYSHIQYEIHRYRDIRNLANTPAYLVIATHRVVIPNAKPYQVGANTGAFTSFSNYPAALTNSITVATQPTSGATPVLRELFPRTLNAHVSTSVETQSSDSSSSTTQQGTGSSTSQSNSFGVSLSGGFFGELPVGNLTVDYQHSWGSGSYTSASSGHGAGHQAGSSGGETMSVKDWSSYGQIGADNVTPTWVWGQSYPWDVILYNQSQDGDTIVLPQFVQSRMMTTVPGSPEGGATAKTYALPPSQLSLFGIDFTMKASWLIDFPEVTADPMTATFTHALTWFTASHSITETGADAALNAQIGPGAPANFTTPPLDLSTYALDPITSVRNGAGINFTTAGLFMIPPTATGSLFRIVSTGNTLQVTGTGFAPGLETDFSLGHAQLTVQFKIVDMLDEYSLLIHHWVGKQGDPVAVQVTVNGNTPTTISVDTAEGQGGQSNISTISLRDLNYSSVNFHDYLQLGINEITVTATGHGGSGATYCLSAIAVGQA